MYLACLHLQSKALELALAGLFLQLFPVTPSVMWNNAMFLHVCDMTWFNDLLTCSIESWSDFQLHEGIACI